MKQIKTIVIFAVIIIFLFTLIKIFNVTNIILEQIYPLKYQEQVEKYAKENEIDDLFIYAIIKSESNFDKYAKSISGAKGLMQIMDATAKEIAEKLEVAYNSEDDLYNSELNIMFGTKYFSDLLKEYNNNVKLAIAAYNAGTGNVRKWIENGIIEEDGSDIENIPFKETNMYVRRILQSYKMYKQLYE